MEKTTITSHKSHMSCRERPASRAAVARLPGVAVMPAAAASKMLVNVFAAALQDFVPACIVDASARCESVTMLARGAAAQTVTGPMRATGRQAGPRPSGRARYTRSARRRARAPRRGWLPRRGWQARGAAWRSAGRGRPAEARFHLRYGDCGQPCGALPAPDGMTHSKKGQGAYSATDWTGTKEMPGGLRLSRCETSLGAQDLRLTTLSSKVCV
jgi:hypothetical protein